MILEFTVKNILSFKNKTTFNLQADSKKDNDENIARESNYDILKTIAIFGNNASGKTNIFKALGYSINLLKTPRNIDINTKIPFYPFASNKKNPSFFEIVFIKDNIKYIYGFSFNSFNFIDEYLYYYPNGKMSLIFKRINTNNFIFPQKDRFILNRVSKELLHNELFLTFITNRNYELTKLPYTFLTQEIMIVKDPEKLKNYSQRYLYTYKDNEKIKKQIIGLLSSLDLNIFNYEINKIKLPEVLISKLADNDMEEYQYIYETFITHKYKDSEFNLNINFESLGTQTLFYLLPLVLNCINSKEILVIDEIDKSLHSSTIISLIDFFIKSSTNSQLIFNTHDTNLLDLKLFRRDQLWIVNKDINTGSSYIKSLKDYHTRKNSNIEKLYLNNRFINK